MIKRICQCGCGEEINITKGTEGRNRSINKYKRGHAPGTRDRQLKEGRERVARARENSILRKKIELRLNTYRQGLEGWTKAKAEAEERIRQITRAIADLKDLLE